ncbi:unnamed protein product [Psylliodes chrysocephalus]|uniref:BESS domain-containing protein n=1 Tax=Psylliodes chrysocephalus TaxID=3402493 RepID=A0A9P0CV86_9CUCU|nr:unnamed protein product [Psylliodes chrysocephala]
MGNPEQNIQEIEDLEKDLNDDLENSTQEKLDSQSGKPLTEINNTDNDNNINRASSKTPKRLKHAETSEERLKLLKKIAEKHNNEEQDETDLFFVSMAKIVKKLPEREQVYLRLQIGTMVGNAQLIGLQQQDSTGRSMSACSSASGNYNPQNESSSSTLSSTPQPAFSDYSTSAVPLLSPNDSEHFLQFYNM